MTTMTGRCYCGAIEYSVEGPERYACFCHCRSCQQLSGAACVPWATFDRDSFAVTKGSPAVVHSSPGVSRGFCRDCGSSLTYEIERRAGDIDIIATSLDDPAAVRPRSHVWVEDKQPWVTIGDDLPRYERTGT